LIQLLLTAIIAFTEINLTVLEMTFITKEMIDGSTPKALQTFL
jgi:hypothetical protein